MKFALIAVAALGISIGGLAFAGNGATQYDLTNVTLEDTSLSHYWDAYGSFVVNYVQSKNEWHYVVQVRDLPKGDYVLYVGNTEIPFTVNPSGNATIVHKCGLHKQNVLVRGQDKEGEWVNILLHKHTKP